MLITDFSIRRPVFAVALSLIITLVGILSLRQLSLQHFPEVEEPVLTVQTNYRGASPYVVESKITNIMEEQFGGLTGIDYIESTSESGRSQITLHFKEGTSLQDASADVRERLSQIRDQLPDDVKDPRIMKSDTNDRAFMTLVFQSPTMNEMQLYDYVDRNVRGRLEAVSGVADCMLYGSPYTMQIRLKRDRLKAYSLTVAQILQTIENSSQDMPSGNITKGGRQVTVMTTSGLNTPESMGKLVLMAADDGIVYLKDVAHITLDKDDSNFAWEPRFNQETAIFAALNKMSGGNMLSISNQVEEMLPEIQAKLPDGMTVKLGYNFSRFIKASLDAVQHTILEAVVLVLLIIFFFLRSARASFIPLMTIPVSLIGSFAFLYAFNCSINTLTLLAMVLAIGLVVDDAIIILENIHRHIEEGKSPKDAALQGSREVGFAIIAMTLTLASVYAPIAFVQGLTGQLFAEFAVALAGAVLVSGLVALTLSPMMCSLLLRPHKEEKPWAKKADTMIKSLESTYEKSLSWMIQANKTVSLILVGVLALAGVLFKLLPQELAPQEDQGIVMSWTQGPQGATLEIMKGYAEQVEAIFAATPEVAGIWSAAQQSGVFAGMTLVDWSERNRSQSDIINSLRKKFQKLPGVQAHVFPMKTILSGGQGGVQIAIKTAGDLNDLEETMEKLVDKVKSLPYFASASHDLRMNTPQLNVSVDREKAAMAGISLDSISNTLESMLGGRSPITFEMNGKHYDVIVQAIKQDKQGISEIQDFYIQATSPSGVHELLPIGQFIKINEVATPSEIKHFNKMRTATLSAELADGQDLQTALDATKQIIADTLKADMQMEYAGHMREFFSSKANMYLIFLAAILFIYLVLAIQFNSFIDPLLILVTVPLSMTGAMLALYLTGCSLNIFSQVGLITLVGLITKHGILIVEFANKRMEMGLSAQEAVKEAAQLRLRPILMTTGAMVLGAVPLALATGAGAETRQQIGWVLVGGLLVGTFLTIFIIPFVYSHVKHWLGRDYYPQVSTAT